ncbi:MAG: hypothetical protein R2777_03135 [Chitinophagales bacterium]
MMRTDDYISKPIKPRLLVSKIKSLLRRISREKTQSIIEEGGIKADIAQRLVFKNNEELFYL